ncbi:MAG: septal ring lytic transglycosylase RlpA family protein, partial [Hyphomicrobium sp.]
MHANRHHGKAAHADRRHRAQKATKSVRSIGGGQSGMASWYGGKFHGRKTANGERYNQWSMTAAHKTLPFGTRVRVTNARTGNSVVVRINDRGPFIKGRIIDLSKAAANQLGING